VNDFKLSDTFISKFAGRQPKWGPLGYFTFKRTYGRELEKGRTEEFWQTCQRVVEGTFSVQKRHCMSLKLPWNAKKAQKSAQEMFERMWDFKFLPPGRGLWMMGSSYVMERGTAASLNNCGLVSTDEIHLDFSAPFVWVMDMSMLGVGCGFDTKGRHQDLVLKKPRVSTDTHIIEDSREGWVGIIRRILDAYVGKDTLPTEIDYSKIRSEGESIRGFGGTSSGSVPLIRLVGRLRKELDFYVEKEKPVDSVCITDLMNFIGECVVAGNVRRSAEISFSEPEDIDFLNLKNYKEYGAQIGDKPRWVSNNSVMATIGKTDYHALADNISQNGEPGLLWLDNVRGFSRMQNLQYPDNRDRRVCGANPCMEQSLESFELCCLVETFPSKHESLEDYLHTLKYAYLYAKTVTLMPTHDARTNAVMMRNRRIGTSQSGIVENFVKIGRREHFHWCDKGYEYLKQLDEIYSDWLCVPRSIKITSVKPSGTVSLLPGVTPGIHYPHSEYYVRRVRVGKTSPLVKAMADAGYKIEPCVGQEDSTVVIEFPVHENNYSRCKKDVTMWEQLENVAQMQAFWADNQVSATVTVKPEELVQIPYALELYEVRLKGVSFLPLEDHGYVQAPYEEITKEQFEREDGRGTEETKVERLH